MLRKFSLILFLVLTAGAAHADKIGDSIVAQLRAQGFSRIEVGRTLLGRARVIAKSPTMTREIVYNPSTGVIMRDYSTTADNRGVSATILDPSRGHTGRSPGRGHDGNSGDDSGDDSGSSGEDGGDDSGGDDSGGDDSGGDDGGGDDGGGDDGGGEDGGGEDGGDGNGEGDD